MDAGAINAAEIGKRAVENNFNLNYSAEEIVGMDEIARAEQLKKVVNEKAQREISEIAQQLAEIGVDMTPILGDAKAFYDAEDSIDYILATIGVVPGSDTITKPLKEAKELYQSAKRAEKSGNISELNSYLTKASKELEKVKALDVGSYRELQKRSVVGDNLDLDHVPSFASLKKAKENELGRKLSPKEEKALKDEATAVAVPKDVHLKSRTFGANNTKKQIMIDANNLCSAQKCDLDKMKKSLIEKGYKSEDINNMINEIIKRNHDRGIK